MLTEFCGCCAESLSDVGGVDLAGRIGFDLFSQGRDGDREIEQFLLDRLDPRDVAGVRQGDLVEQADRAVGPGELLRAARRGARRRPPSPGEATCGAVVERAPRARTRGRAGRARRSGAPHGRRQRAHRACPEERGTSDMAEATPTCLPCGTPSRDVRRPSAVGADQHVQDVAPGPPRHARGRRSRRTGRLVCADLPRGAANL